MTHEMVEAITDPLLNGWVHDIGAGNLDEIADACSANYTVNGVICSGYFSNEDNACIAPVVTPSWVKCSTGYIYDPATQTCKKVSITAAATTTTVQVADPVLILQKHLSLETRVVCSPIPCKCISYGGVQPITAGLTRLQEITGRDQIKIFDSAYYDACLHIQWLDVQYLRKA